MKRNQVHTILSRMLGTIILGVVSAPALAVMECDVPLISQQTTSPPNVLIILDTSGSMNHHIEHPAYDASITYTGGLVADKEYTYSGSTPSLRGANYFRSGQPSSPKFMVSRGPNGQAGRYWGNYLNWAYFHATDAQRAEISLMTRMEAGQLAINAVFDQAPNLRYGLMTFNGDDGGDLQANIGTDMATLRSTVNASYGTGWTPSAETMVTALDYFKSTGAGAPILAHCQGSFIIFVTDGHPTQDLDIPSYIGDQDGDGMEPGNCEAVGLPASFNGDNCSHYLDDVAYYLSHNDMRTDLDGDQFVFTYTIGFGIDAPIMALTAQHGGGSYHLAWDLGSLTESLGLVIGDIVARISAGAAVAVVSTESGDDNNLYRGKFLPGMWRGYLEAFELPYEQGQAPIWEAGELLRGRSESDRTIFTLVDGQQVEFEAGQADALIDFLGVADVTEATNVINYARGAHIDGARDRGGWKLGDLVYSTPVVVGGPTRFILESGYQTFLRDYANRERMIYVGANDGMLHAFRASDGTELWAYAALGTMHKLQDLMSIDYCHSSFVDLTPAVYDVEINGAWRTVLFGGERSGGDSYFAIDVTEPTNPQVLWEQSYPVLGSSYTQPALIRTSGYTALWTGSAPDPAGNAFVNIIDVQSGYLAVPMVHVSMHTDINMMSGAVGIDWNFDGFDDIVYQADLKGNLYRWVRDSSNNWLGWVVFQTGDQPIQAKPVAAFLDGHSMMVLFGTGRYLETSDVSSSGQQTFYALRDDLNFYTSYGPGDLVDQTNSIQDTAGSHGWRFDLTMDDAERVVEPAAVVEGVVYFTSFAPTDAECSAGGESWLYAVDFRTGAPIDPETLEPSEEVTDRGTSLGDGVASRPVISLGDGSLIVQTSDVRLSINDLTIPPRTMVVRSWREQTQGNAETTTTTTQQQ